MSASDLSRQLRLVLEHASDAPSVPSLLENIDAFVRDHRDSPDAGAIALQLEEELQNVNDNAVNHSVCSQLEVFLAVLYHLRTLLPPLSVISTWFDLVIRPALREPKLSTPAVNHAKELILAALEPPPSDSEEPDEEKRAENDRRREKVGNFRRRLMDYYLLDAYNESSGEDVLEWASLDDITREKKATWKANLEDVLVKTGLQRPNALLTELYHCYASPTSRVQLLLFLNSYTSQAEFPDAAAASMASHMLMHALLYSLIFDNSSTLCTIGLTVLTKLLPIFAVKAGEDLKRLLPRLLIALARIICWKQRPLSTLRDLSPEQLGVDPEVAKDLNEDIPEEEDDLDNTNKLPIRPDLEWNRLEAVFSGTSSGIPPPHQFFAFLYYLFPCNTLRFLRFPVSYLADNNVESLYTVDWEEALDEDMIRSKSEPLLRGHVLHPLLIWRDAASELEQPDFWEQYDIPQIVGECTMLDVRSASLGLREQGHMFARSNSKPAPATQQPILPPIVEPIPIPALSSSAESSASSVLAHIPAPVSPQKPRISLQEMISTSIALKSGLEVEIVDPTPTWPMSLFHQPRTGSPSHEPHSSRTATPAPDSASFRGRPSDDMIPSHVGQAIAELQREVLLLRSDLNLELWIARENVRHIGRLYHDRVLSRNAEIERQGLHNKMKEYKAEVHRLQKELKDHKDQTSTMKNQYADYNQKLQDKLRDLRAEKASWVAEAAAMRAADKEAKATFVAQGKLLAEATNRVFQLETKIKENAHKIDRLHDYERQIEQLIRMQRLWETDVHQLNEQNEYLKVFTSKYRKMELQLETFEKIQAQMDDNARQHRQQMQLLEARLAFAQKQLENARKIPSLADLSQYRDESTRLSQANEQLREENSELRDEVEELRAMIESLKARIAGNRDALASPRASPLIPHANTSF
ncbi:hypothetical protein K474DRAFT_1590953 [Panus rudis PR-1116 ss-1]|nr:hypothetical protein K474DRAFT_1590953 [Panus rudis PR-1116 ss-1]